MTAHLDVSPAWVLLSSLAARMSCILNLNLNLSVLGTAPETSWPFGPPEHGGVCFPDKKEFQGSLGILGLSEASAVTAGEASR